MSILTKLGNRVLCRDEAAQSQDIFERSFDPDDEKNNKANFGVNAAYRYNLYFELVS
jgi:hypothetical protein